MVRRAPFSMVAWLISLDATCSLMPVSERECMVLQGHSLSLNLVLAGGGDPNISRPTSAHRSERHRLLNSLYSCLRSLAVSSAAAKFNMKLIRLTTVLLVLTTFANAQTIRPANQKTRKNDSSSEFQQRRATALSILQSLAIEARSYSDEPLRARVQAQIADVLWTHDKEAARSLFRRAWEIAEALDQAAVGSNLPGRRPTNSSR